MLNPSAIKIEGMYRGEGTTPENHSLSGSWKVKVRQEKKMDNQPHGLELDIMKYYG